jgi:hypothetical protein
MSFLPENYEENKPTSGSGYTKFKPGTTTIRVISDAITGYEGWQKLADKSQPMRFKDQREAVLTPGLEDVKFFVAFTVWNYTTEQVEICKITQSSIREILEEYSSNPQWGHPKGYDLVIKRTGEGLETTYVVTASPPSPIKPEIAEAVKGVVIDWEEYMNGGDPFTTKSETVDPSDVPF